MKYASVTWILDISTRRSTSERHCSASTSAFKSDIFSSLLRLQPPFFGLKSWPNFWNRNCHGPLYNVLTFLGSHMRWIVSTPPVATYDSLTRMCIRLKAFREVITCTPPPTHPCWTSARICKHRQHANGWMRACSSYMELTPGWGLWPHELLQVGLHFSTHTAATSYQSTAHSIQQSCWLGVSISFSIFPILGCFENKNERDLQDGGSTLFFRTQDQKYPTRRGSFHLPPSAVSARISSSSLPRSPWMCPTCRCHDRAAREGPRDVDVLCGEQGPRERSVNGDLVVVGSRLMVV